MPPSSYVEYPHRAYLYPSMRVKSDSALELHISSGQMMMQCCNCRRQMTAAGPGGRADMSVIAASLDVQLVSKAAAREI